MSRIKKAAFFLFSLSLVLLSVTPRASACCRPCEGFCSNAVPESAFCCQGPVPGNACGLTTCGEYLG
jgi:hypothetical protein